MLDEARYSGQNKTGLRMSQHFREHIWKQDMYSKLCDYIHTSSARGNHVGPKTYPRGTQNLYVSGIIFYQMNVSVSVSITSGTLLKKTLKSWESSDYQLAIWRRFKVKTECYLCCLTPIPPNPSSSTPWVYPFNTDLVPSVFHPPLKNLNEIIILLSQVKYSVNRVFRNVIVNSPEVVPP